METAEVPSKDPEVTEVEEGNLKVTDQTTIPTQIIRSRDGKLAGPQERKTERSLLFMIAAGVVCQIMSHDVYSWCVTLLTLLATGAQGQEVDKPWTLNIEMLEDEVVTKEGVSPGAPEPQGPPARKPSLSTAKDKQTQPTTTADDPWCKETKHRMDRAERSLLFLTAAGAVCQIGDREWYGMCVLTLAMLASGVQATEEDGPPCLREKRAAIQEAYHLEAYDCSEPQDTIVYHIPQ